MKSFLIPCAVAFASLLATSTATAGSHLWRFNEFYSSPDGSVQFIEMVEVSGSSIENAIAGHWFETTSYNADHSDLLGSNIVGNTANKKFLVGTESYATRPGVPAPDYIIPDGVINPNGDTVVWWFYQTIVIPPNFMPTNGVDSINVVNPDVISPTGTDPNHYTVAVNSPTNFAGQTGTVVFSTVPAFSPYALGLLALGCAVIGVFVLRRRAAAAA